MRQSSCGGWVVWQASDEHASGQRHALLLWRVAKLASQPHSLFLKAHLHSHPRYPPTLPPSPEAGVVVVPHAHPAAMLPAVPAEVLAIGAMLAVPKQAQPRATVLAAGLPHVPAPSWMVVGVWHAGQGGAFWLHQVRQGAAAGQQVK